MISKIRIQNFKSLEDVTLECKNLNVLTGLNGMGKSSIIQVILLLRQSYERGFLRNEGLSLNGDLVNIGSGKEALYEFATSDEISFTLDFDDNSDYKQVEWNFSYQRNSPGLGEDEYKFSGSDFLPFWNENRPKEGLKGGDDMGSEEKIIDPFVFENYDLFKINTFNYLNADRWVKNEYEISDYQVVRNNNLGRHGQYTTHYLNQYSRKPIHENLLFPYVEVNELLAQVTGWMSEISPDTKIITDKIPGVNSVKLRYVFTYDDLTSSEMTPLNVGFGITYVLPVLVALLSAKAGDILIIENPESHIHPQGQSALGNLIGLVAQLGAQIFVETHSDHIINGICLSINKSNLDQTLTKINFIHKKNGEKSSKNYEVTIDSNGRVDDAILQKVGIGFFDQIHKDLSSIMFSNKEVQGK